MQLWVLAIMHRLGVCCLFLAAVLCTSSLNAQSTQRVEDRSELRHRYAAPAPANHRAQAQRRSPASEPVVAPPQANVDLYHELERQNHAAGMESVAGDEQIIVQPTAPSVLLTDQLMPASRPIWVANRLRMDPADVQVLRAAAEQPTLIIVRPQPVVVTCGCCGGWGYGCGGNVIRYQSIGYFNNCWTSARWYRGGYRDCGRWGPRERSGFSLRYRSGSESGSRFSVRAWSRF